MSDEKDHLGDYLEASAKYGDTLMSCLRKLGGKMSKHCDDVDEKELLEPCPFCGHKPLLSPRNEEGGQSINCAHCSSLEMYSAVEPLDSFGANWKYLTEDELIKQWNNRRPSQENRGGEVVWPEYKNFFTDPKGVLSQHQREAWNAAIDACKRSYEERKVV